MIRATELSGRPVIDIDAAEKMGAIDKIILDPEGRRVAGFIVAKGSGFGAAKDRTIVPAAAVHAIGPDAVTIRQSAVVGSDIGRLEALPRGADVIGRKVVSEDGRALGKVSDVLIDRASGRIVGYLLSDHKPSQKIQALFSGDKKARRDTPYLPADTNLRAGRDLIVASEDALSYDWSDKDVAPEPGGPIGRWTDPLPPSDTASAWVRRGTPDEADRPSAELGSSESGGADDGRETNPHV
jgi:uncharacterized protein YrrD